MTIYPTRIIESGVYLYKSNIINIYSSRRSAKMFRNRYIMTMAIASIAGTQAFAAVTAEEAKQLGGAKLTVFGAEKAGNKEGTIPEYKGEIIKAPAGFDKSTPGNYTIDPWNDKPLFTITAQNAAKYADKLDGMVEMFKKYPNYRMDIYPTRRTTVLPKYVLDNTIKNATNCKTTDNEMKLDGCYGGVPFPIPKSGAQVMWNHLLAYEGYAAESDFDSWMIAGNGNITLINSTVVTQKWPLFDPARTTPNGPKDIYWYCRVDITAPARRVGEKIVLIDAVDALGIGRRAYQYIPGQRRVKLAPDISYDTPSPFGGGGKTMDDSKTFLGAMDRYDWKLVGKKEKYLIENNFKSTDYKLCPPVVFTTKNFPNPDCIRWELHRVWVVEATLKSSFRHIYRKRIFYFDEDGYRAGSAENYDAANSLYRYSNTVYYPHFDDTGAEASTSIVQDIQNGSWVIEGLHSQKGQGSWAIKAPEDRFFSPEILAGAGVR